MTYKLLNYRGADCLPRAGLLANDHVFDAAEVTGVAAYQSILVVLNDWAAAHVRFAAKTKAGLTGGTPLAAVKLLAPIEIPGAIYCAGANFTDHMQEMARVMNLPVERDPHEIGLTPWHFVKTARGSVRGPGEAIKMPAYSKMLDWEIELVAVIGRTTKDASLDHALASVAGYTIGNDLSARDFVKRDQVDPGSPFKWDWMSQKCFDGSLPLGPWITPAADIADPQKLAMKLWVDHELMQDSNSDRMIFSVAEQIAHLSSRITLYPGDLVCTGTPAGVGMARKRFLKPGETVKVWIEGIGEFSNRMAS